VLATVGTLVVALVWQLATTRHGGASSLSDLPRLFLARRVGPGGLPYVSRVLEYPVGAGILFYLAAVVAPSPVGVLVVTALAAGVAAVAITVLLERRSGSRAWRWALASPLLLYAFQNWDVFALLALVAGIAAYERRRPAASGVLLGLGTTVKVFPAVAVPVLAAHALARGDRRAAGRLVAGALATVALLNLPFAVADVHGWWWTFRFQGARPATWGSPWRYVDGWLGLPTHGGAAASLANTVSIAVLVVGLGALAVRTAWHRLPPVPACAAAVAIFLLANKVWSPAYDLWIVPFFVLLPLGRRWWLALCAADLVVYVTVFGWFHGLHGIDVVHTVLPWAVAARVVVLLVVIAQAVVTAPEAPGSRAARVCRNLADARHRPVVGRLARCMSVSVLTTALSLVSLVVLTSLGLAATLANVLTTALATIPSYHLNRRWTWRKHGASHLWREVVPFWAMSFAGLALSTVTVGLADGWASAHHVTGALHTGAILAGHLGGFGILWIAQFVLLDRVLFAPGTHAPSPSPST